VAECKCIEFHITGPQGTTMNQDSTQANSTRQNLRVPLQRLGLCCERRAKDETRKEEREIEKMIRCQPYTQSPHPDPEERPLQNRPCTRTTKWNQHDRLCGVSDTKLFHYDGRSKRRPRLQM